MKAVLTSIQPKWVEEIASGRKTIEVRKTAPKCEVPFKGYIYETKGKKIECGFHLEDTGITLREKIVFGMHKARIVKHYRNEGRGKVIGEFVCDKVEKFDVPYPAWDKSYLKDMLEKSCLTYNDLHSYIGSGNSGYGWHISDLKIYDKPKELTEFRVPCPTSCENCKNPLYYECWCEEKGIKVVTRAPQSWQYVEEL